MRETWYVLEDGTAGDPQDIAPNAKGVLMHKNGIPVQLRANGVPLTSGVDVAAERAKAAQNAKAKEVHAEPVHETKEIIADKPGKPYKTRDMKAG